MGSTALDLVPSPGSMVTGSSPISPASATGIGRLTVTSSGESILFNPQDSQGNPLSITSLRASDDYQTIALTGVAQSSSFTLSLDGHTTTPIPLAKYPPIIAFGYTTTLPAAGTYDIAMSWGFYGSPPGPVSQQAYLEVLDAGKTIGSVTFDQSQYPDDTVDIAVPNVGVFKSLGTFTFTSTTFEVRLSGVAGSGELLAGTLRVVPHGSTDPATIGYIDTATNRTGGSDGALEGYANFAVYGYWTQTYFHTNVGGWHAVWFASAMGTQSTLFPAVADIQSALQALPNIPPGAVQVTPRYSQTFSVHFIGPLSAHAISTLVSSDPAFTIIHDGTADSSIGGLFPSVTVNGTSYPLQALSYSVGRPYVVYHLLQDAPDIQYARYGQGLTEAGYFAVQYNSGFSGRIGYPTSSGTLAIWRFQALLGSATYQLAITWPGGDPNGDLLEVLVQDGQGNTLADLKGIDQSQAPNDFQEGGVGWKILAQFTLPGQNNDLSVTAIGSGTANKHSILDAVRLSRVSARQSIQIQPTDQVFFNAPAGFATTSAGPLPAVNQIPVTPASPSRLPAIPSGPKTMKIGVNVDPPGCYGTDSYFANLAVQAVGRLGQAQTAAGNPTQLLFDPQFGIGASGVQLSAPPTDAGGLGRGVPKTPNGVWVVQWQGSSWNYCLLQAGVNTTSVVEDVSRRVVGPVNRRYFQVGDYFQNAPTVSLAMFSSQLISGQTYACDITNVAVYPADVDPNQTSRWRPGFLQKLKGLHCVRFMDLFGTNNLNLSSFSHFPDPANFPLGYGFRTIAIPIVSIGPPVPDGFAENVAGTVVQVKTASPHGLATGFRVGLRSGDGGSLGLVLGNTIDPHTNATTSTARDPIEPTDQYNGVPRQNLCHVIDATTLQIGLNVGSGPLARMVNTLTPANGYVYADVAPGAMMAPADAADLCAEAGVEPWVNVPWLADDDCVTRLAQAFANRLPRGTLVHVEYGNEAWNSSFSGFFYSVWQNNLNGNAGINYVPYYAARMGQVHTIFQNVWKQAGRNPSEIRRVCGSQSDNAGGTAGPIVQFALANGLSFDEVAPASYYSNGPASGSADDLLTREQLLDLFAINVGYSELPAAMAANAQIFTAALAQNPTATWLGAVELVNYEGGPDTMTTSTMSANLANRNHGVHRDPDFCAIELNHLQLLEDAGVKLFNIFTLYGTRDVNQWGVYEGAAMQAGTGNAAIDLANRNDFEDLPVITSETAAALQQWVAMVPKSIVSPTVLRNEFTIGIDSF